MAECLERLYTYKNIKFGSLIIIWEHKIVVHT
jgi:hypothetical protein